jgi:prevent-host-death family protein
MTDQVNVQDAKTRLSELLTRVERGEQITIARAGKPIARLVAVETPVKRELGFVAGGPIADTFFDALSDDELHRWDSA